MHVVRVMYFREMGGGSEGFQEVFQGFQGISPVGTFKAWVRMSVQWPAMEVWKGTGQPEVALEVTGNPIRMETSYAYMTDEAPLCLDRVP